MQSSQTHRNTSADRDDEVGYYSGPVGAMASARKTEGNETRSPSWAQSKAADIKMVYDKFKTVQKSSSLLKDQKVQSKTHP